MTEETTYYVAGCPFCHSGNLEVESIKRYPESDEPAIELISTLFSGDGHVVVCNNCDANGPIGSTPEEAVELWNKRDGDETE